MISIFKEYFFFLNIKYYKKKDFINFINEKILKAINFKKDKNLN